MRKRDDASPLFLCPAESTHIDPAVRARQGPLHVLDVARTPIRVFRFLRDHRELERFTALPVRQLAPGIEGGSTQHIEAAQSLANVHRMRGQHVGEQCFGVLQCCHPGGTVGDEGTFGTAFAIRLITAAGCGPWHLDGSSRTAACLRRAPWAGCRLYLRRLHGWGARCCSGSGALHRLRAHGCAAALVLVQLIPNRDQQQRSASEAAQRAAISQSRHDDTVPSPRRSAPHHAA
jgi:hypothetical protein